MRTLLDGGADVSARGRRYGNTLYAAPDGGHEKVVEPLPDKGADVNAKGGRYGNALQAALQRGHMEVVQMLHNKMLPAYSTQFWHALDTRQIHNIDS